MIELVNLNQLNDISDDDDYINKDNKECVFINMYDGIEFVVINMIKNAYLSMYMIVQNVWVINMNKECVLNLNLLNKECMFINIYDCMECMVIGYIYVNQKTI